MSGVNETREPLFVRTQGPDSAPSVVFLHGGGVSGWSWGLVVERLVDTYHCLIPDLPEHGRSVHVGPLSLPLVVDGVAAVIREQAHGGRAHLVGLSLGSQAGLLLLASQPQLVERAVLSGTSVRPSPGVQLIDPLMRLYAPFRTAGPLVRANMRSLGIPDRFFDEVRADTELLTRERLGRVLLANQTFRLPHGLDCSEVPTLVTVGEREPRVMHQSAREIVSVLPNALARLVRGVGHAWPLQAPELCALTVRAWLSDARLPDALEPLS